MNMKTRFKMPDPRKTFEDVILFNTRVYNDTHNLIDLKTEDTTRTDLLKNAGDYYLILDTFKIDNTAVAIMIIDDSNREDYLFSFIDDFGVRQDLYMSGQPSIYDFEPNGVYKIDLFLGQLQDFIRQVPNYDLTTVSLVEQDNRISINYDSDAEEAITTTTEVILGCRLGVILSSFQNVIYRNNQWILVLPELEYDNVDDEIIPVQIIEDYLNYDKWTDIEAILIGSPSLPVIYETFSSESGSTASKFKVLNDFIPLSGSSTPLDRTAWTLQTDYPKLIDMRGDHPIQRIELNAFIQRRDRRARESVKLLPCTEAFFKLRFVKKALFNNEYNLTDIDDRVKQHPVPSYHKI